MRSLEYHVTGQIAQVRVPQLPLFLITVTSGGCLCRNQDIVLMLK